MMTSGSGGHSTSDQGRCLRQAAEGNDDSWTGGAIGGANIDFGAGSYLQVPVDEEAGGQTTGTATLQGTLSGDVCGNLGHTCHQLVCNEQLYLPDGTSVTNAAVQQMVLDCTGGEGCDSVSTCDFDPNSAAQPECPSCLIDHCATETEACFGDDWTSGAGSNDQACLYTLQAYQAQSYCS